MDEKQKKTMTKEQREVLDSAMAELNEMLRSHEQYKEEYGAKMAALTEEERDAEYMRQLDGACEIIEKMGMKTENIDKE